MYTDTPHPSWDLYITTMGNLSTVIDEVRGVYENMPGGAHLKGWFPFEPIRQIYWEIRDLGYGPEVSMAQRQHARERIEEMWYSCREELLREFERAVPTFHHADYLYPLSPGHLRQQETKSFSVLPDPRQPLGQSNHAAPRQQA
jgi:hypothetical protein